MPILSDRKLFQRELEDVLRTLALFDDDDSSDFEEILDIQTRLEETRYFKVIVGTHKVFNTRPSNYHHRHKQCAVWIQLACVLH